MMSNIPEGYKQTDVGVIPVDWEVKKLGEIVRKFVNGGTPSTQFENYWNGNIPWITGADILNQEVSAIRRYITNDAVKHSSTNVIEKGNLLLVSRTGVGKLAIAPFDVAISQDFTGIYVKNEELLTEYLYRYFDFNQSTLQSQNQGTSIQGITRDTLSSIPIPLPPLPEQQAIASALSDVDALISALEQLITKKRNIKQGAMQQLLTGKKRLPGFGGEWEVKNLGEVLKVRHGKSQQGIIDENGLYPILGTGGEIGRANIFLYDKPSVLIGRKGTIDIPRYMETPFWTIDTLFFTEVSDNTNPKFIFYKFNLIDWYSYNEASGVPSLNASTIEKIELSFPPTVKEQTAIAQILSDMDTEIEALEQKRDKYRALKQGMMQELLTGRTRLV
ncbi:restriction endonuclease S subunit [Candidatus Methanoperedens nitroreducens]|uniref:Restriction endonuclease S subunit n=1 Tax=Candidatus Methanoperedens nitratireducens TaxID=1392998 RepID=A0A062V876_9EURY|nr:restriction endonuclease subunit S [Candidatus Methanoperedens nitroreducens]KCZ72788.1 restriction endonuclease S subunit [Candidatus Methanoperedens nitroreducens]MCZ7622478.1 restriction endonuclease subunit S [Candidatus Kuenenia sp.]MDJ1423283.1 restriction endonuclease subunit S [Candidatus Methanoperedens sp.]